MSAFREELKKFKADLTSSLAARIIVLEPTPADEPLFDLFDSDNPPSRAPRKRPIEDDNVEERQVHQKTSAIDEEEDEDAIRLVLRVLRDEEELRKSQEWDRLLDIGSSNAVVARTTPSEGCDQRQLETGA